MSGWNLIYFIAFAAGAAATLITTPLFRLLAVRLDFMDRPQNNHKGHVKATPLLGGVAMYVSWVLCIAGGLGVALSGISPQLTRAVWQHLAGLGLAMPKLGVLTLGGGLCVLLGLIDDKWAMSASVKFSGQFAIALLAVTFGGVEMNIFIENRWITGAATLFWIMLMMNSINFFDNMDGLAVGTIAIAMGFFAVIAALNQQYFIGVLAALSCGVSCGFWYYNSSPATIFMGDAGSHFLGYLAAVVSAGISWFGVDFSLSRFPVLIPFFILALPLFDTAMVVLIRTRNRKPFWIGDHNHISHRFVRMGLSRRQAVLLVHLLALGIGLGTLPMFWGDFRTAAVLTLQSFIILLIITIMQFALSDQARQNQNTRETK